MTTDLNEKVGEVTIKINVTMQNVDDILCTAFDRGYGGALYWATPKRPGVMNEPVEYVWEVITKNRQTMIVMEDPEHGAMIPHSLDLERFLHGFQIWCEQQNQNGRSLPMDDGEIDCGMIDANDADNIVQYAIFGRLVYG